MSTRVKARKDLLIADGIDFYRRMLAELFRGQGFRVLEAETADEAEGLVESERPDLVLLDLGLPPQGGGAWLEALATRHGIQIRSVALSHVACDPTEVDRLRGLGVAACVPRSCPVDDILAAVRAALFPEAKDLRRSPRAQVHIPVAYRVDEGTPGAAEVGTHSFNLSSDGMFVVTATVAPPAPGTRLGLRFWLPGAPQVISAEGVVIWCNQAGRRLNELYPPGMGVMFLGLSREQAAIIGEYVRERTVNPFR